MFNLDFPIIAAARTPDDFLAAVKSPCEIIFWLSPTIMTLEPYIAKAHALEEEGDEKSIFVHIDMTDGIGKDSAGLEYLHYLGVDGIISTRGNLIKSAREAGLITVQRFFIVDSRSITTAFDTVRSSKPDMIEIMPGLMPGVITHFAQSTDLPVIAGGLIECKDDVIAALSAGASAISTSKEELWFE